MIGPTLRAEHKPILYTQAYTAVTDPPSGGWTWFVEPTAVEYNGTIYFTYINGSNGNACIRTIDSTSLAVSAETVLHAALQQDDHAVPSVLLRASDHKIICFYCQHVGAHLYQRISSNAEDISAFAAETDLATPLGLTTGYSYPSAAQLTGETNNPIYLFWRDQTGTPTTDQLYYSKSTDEGATWAARTLLYAETGRSSYWKIVDDGSGRIDFAVTNGHPYWDAPNIIEIGHFYYTGGSFYKTDGTAMGSPPFTFSSMTTVYSGSATSWIWDIALKAGVPYLVYATWPSYPNTVDTRLNYGAWNGSAWQTHDVCGGGSRDLDPVSGHYYTGGIALDRVHPDSTVYCSCEVDSQYEMFKYVSGDAGSTWTGRQISYRSAGLNMRPVGIRGYAGKLAALWMYAAQYTSYTSYSAATRGARA